MGKLEEICCFEIAAMHEKEELKNEVAYNSYKKFGCIGCYDSGRYLTCELYLKADNKYDLD